MIARIRRRLNHLHHRIRRHQVVEYEVCNGVITIDRPMSEADLERFRRAWQREHGSRPR